MTITATASPSEQPERDFTKIICEAHKIVQDGGDIPEKIRNQIIEFFVKSGRFKEEEMWILASETREIISRFNIPKALVSLAVGVVRNKVRSENYREMKRKEKLKEHFSRTERSESYDFDRSIDLDGAFDKLRQGDFAESIVEDIARGYLPVSNKPSQFFGNSRSHYLLEFTPYELSKEKNKILEKLKKLL